jgi:hypothetical protein
MQHYVFYYYSGGALCVTVILACIAVMSLQSYDHYVGMNMNT